MFESQITTLEAAEPTVSDVALQLMVAVVASGRTIYNIADCFATAERFVAERDKRSNKPDVATALSVCEEVGELLGMLEEGEYSEAWAKTALCKRLEDALTKLHRELNDAHDLANGWNAYPDVRPNSHTPVLVQYCDGRYDVENPTTDINGTWFFSSTCGVVCWQEIKG